MKKLQIIGFLYVVLVCLLDVTNGNDNYGNKFERTKRSIWTRWFGTGEDSEGIVNGSDGDEEVEVTTLPVILPKAPVHHYPVWKVHKYKGMDLRPMPISMLANHHQLIHVGGQLPSHIILKQQSTPFYVPQLSQSFALPTKNYQTFSGNQLEKDHAVPVESYITKINEKQEPEDELQRLASLIGIKDVAKLPTLDQVMSLVGTSNHDETVEMIRDIASTPEGIQLIKNFLQNHQQPVEDFYLTSSDNHDYNGNDHQHLDTIVVEEHEVTPAVVLEDEHHPKYHPESYSLQEPRTPTIDGYKILPSPGLLALSGVPATLDRTHTNLGIIRTILTTPKPEEGLFSRLRNFANFFRFNEEPEIPIRPVTPTPSLSPQSYQYYVNGPVPAIENSQITYFSAPGSPLLEVPTHQESDHKELYEIDNETEEHDQESIENDGNEEVVEAAHDDNENIDEQETDSDVPHEGVQIPELPSLPKLPQFQGFATIPKIPQIPQLHIPKQFKMPEHIASAHQYPGAYIRVKYPLNGFNPLPHTYKAVSTPNDNVPGHYVKYQPQNKYQSPIAPIISNQYELPASTGGWTPNFYNSYTDTKHIKDTKNTDTTIEKHSSENIKNIGIESLPLDNYDVFKNAPQILTSYGTPALPYTYSSNDKDKQTDYHDYQMSASNNQQIIVAPPSITTLKTEHSTAAPSTLSSPITEQTTDYNEITELKRRSDSNSSYPQRISPFDAVATGKIHIADPDAIQLLGELSTIKTNLTNEKFTNINDADNLSDRVATLTALELNDRIGRNIKQSRPRSRSITSDIINIK